MSSSPDETGVIMKGVDRHVTIENLQSLLQAMGLRYDFLYLPWDSKRNCNIGLAFINFLHGQSAERCIHQFPMMKIQPGKKLCKWVCTSYTHGLASNLAFFLVSAGAEAIHSHHAPLVFDSLGQRISLHQAVAQLVTIDLLINSDKLWRQTRRDNRQGKTTALPALGLGVMDLSFGSRGTPSQQFSGFGECEYWCGMKESGQKPGLEIPPWSSANPERAAGPLPAQQIGRSRDRPDQMKSGFQFGCVRGEHDTSLGCYPMGQHRARPDGKRSSSIIKEHQLVVAPADLGMATPGACSAFKVQHTQGTGTSSTSTPGACSEVQHRQGTGTSSTSTPGACSELQHRQGTGTSSTSTPGTCSEVQHRQGTGTSSTSTPGTCSAFEVQHRQGTGTSSVSCAGSSVRCGFVHAKDSSDSTSQVSPRDGRHNGNGNSGVKFTHIRVGDREITILDF